MRIPEVRVTPWRCAYRPEVLTYDEIAAVIATASARLAANGQQGLWRKRVDDVEYEWRS